MDWQLAIDEWLQKASPPMDWFFKGVTMMGEEIFFIVIAAFIFWCVNKKFGYKFMTVYILGNGAVEGLKSLFKIPRPFKHSSERVRSIGAETGGYSFPSGHSHNAANLFTQLSLRYGGKKNWPVYVVAALFTALVMLSRLYLGQHYFMDVMAGLGLGVFLAIGLGLLFDLLKDKEELLVLGMAPLCVALCVLGGVFDNKNLLTISAVYLAVTIGYFFEKRYVKFDVKARWWIHLIKLVIGLGVAFALKELIKLIPATGGLLHFIDFLRYFLMGAWAVIGAPALFKVLVPALEKLADKKKEKKDVGGTE